MSIEMENPTTLLEKVDAAFNLVEQLYLAHKIKDEKTFEEAHKKAGELLADAIELIGEPTETKRGQNEPLVRQGKRTLKKNIMN